MDRKESTKAAINSFIQRECAPQNNREPTRRNKSPERNTEKDVLKWGRLNGFHLHVVEASTYNPVTRQAESQNSKAEAGFPDVVGNTSTGLVCYIELKAKDRRSKLSESQRRFLEQKISQNCFAVVVDSDKRLEQYWKGFCSLKSGDQRQAFLYDCLPHQKKKKPRDGFEKSFGF